MLNKLSIRLRLTALSVFLLALCCVGLTVVLNLSASNMAAVIETTAVTIPGSEDLQSTPALALVPASPAIATQAAKSMFQQESILYMLLVLAFGGGLTYYMTGRALKPLQNLSTQMQNRTAYNLSERLPVPQSSDEIAALTASFNDMTETLEQAFAMQQRFSQSAAHELRTPLTVLKTKVEVFQKKQAHTPEEYDKLLHVITAHTNRLSSLVTSLLALTNLDAMDCDEPIALPQMLQSIADELSPLAKAAGVQLQVHLEPQADAPQICGNATLLHRAFYNVIENAIKYNVSGGSVEVFLAAQKEHSVVRVADTGTGIPAQARALVFEPFYRVDKSRSRQMGGAGLGLATAKTILDKHHATICADETPDGGTVFTICL